MPITPATASIIASGLGLLTSKRGKSSADKAIQTQQQSIAQQQPMIDAIMRVVNESYGAYSDADKSGAFDPNAERARVLHEHQQLGDLSRRDIAAGSRLAGYRPGDSVIQQQNLITRNALERDTALKLSGLRREMLLKKLATLGATNPGMGGQAANIIGNNANALSSLQAGNSSATNPAALLAAILPYLTRNHGGNSGSSAGNVSGLDSLYMPGGRNGFG